VNAYVAGLFAFHRRSAASIPGRRGSVAEGVGAVVGELRGTTRAGGAGETDRGVGDGDDVEPETGDGGGGEGATEDAHAATKRATADTAATRIVEPTLLITIGFRDAAARTRGHTSRVSRPTRSSASARPPASRTDETTERQRQRVPNAVIVIVASLGVPCPSTTRVG
jgi:hypothetical protein